MSVSAAVRLGLSDEEIKEKAMNWIEGSLICPRSELSNDDRVKIYDVMAGFYDKDMLGIAHYQAHKLAAQFIHSHLKGNLEARILDIGCGTGLLANELKDFSYTNIDGLDPSSEMLKRSNDQGLYSKTYQQYFRMGSGIQEGYYDMAVSVSAFIPGHIEARAVQEMVRIIKPGGFAMITMRARYVAQDEDLQTLRPCIQQLVNEGKAQLIEDREFDRFYNRDDGDSGLLLVIKKL